MKKILLFIVPIAVLTLTAPPTGHIGRQDGNRKNPPPGDMQDILKNPTIDKLATMFTNMSYINNHTESTKWRQSLVDSTSKVLWGSPQKVFDIIEAALKKIAGTKKKCPNCDCDLKEIQETLEKAKADGKKTLGDY
ncbi:MAG TPA: hypothetical protein QGF02_02155 [Candidatus Babeliales bacterium]|nr:hypothetical protein [Candidatus Babeliales bacterium]